MIPMTDESWRRRFAIKDESGKRYGEWQVLRRVENVSGNATWRCQCICCGELRNIAGIKLRAKPPQCACQRKAKP